MAGAMELPEVKRWLPLVMLPDGFGHLWRPGRPAGTAPGQHRVPQRSAPAWAAVHAVVLQAQLVLEQAPSATLPEPH